MKRRGFTLVELLATITILGLIITIIVPAVSKTITNSRKKSYDKVINNVITVTKRYALENSTLLPNEINSLSYIELDTLVDKNLFDTDKLINPITNKELEGYILIKYENEEYKYEFDEGDFYEDKTTVEKSTNVEDSYVGYYADVNNDGEVDGIIFADLVTGATGDGQWTDDNGNYTIPTIDVDGVKDYYLLDEEYDGPFGQLPVVTSFHSTMKDRFYVLSFNNHTQSHWYHGAYTNMYDYATTTSTDFGAGKLNTKNMIYKWKNELYGQNNGASKKDLWGEIIDDEKLGWFLPSKDELSAFGGEICEKFGINNTNHLTYKIAGRLYTSSQFNKNSIWTFYIATFNASLIGEPIGIDYYRLAITF